MQYFAKRLRLRLRLRGLGSGLSESGVRARAGFVLMEAVVALAIISVVAIALLATTAAQVRTAAKAKVLLTSRALAEDRLDAIRLLDYDDLADLPDSLARGSFPAPFEAFAWTAHVEEMDDEYDLFGAEVVVDGGGESFPLRTLIHAPRPLLEVEGGAAGGSGRGGGPGGNGGRGGRGG
jgi:type II secretory pathway pseudopilin PulG